MPTDNSMFFEKYNKSIFEYIELRLKELSCNEYNYNYDSDYNSSNSNENEKIGLNAQEAKWKTKFTI